MLKATKTTSECQWQSHRSGKSRACSGCRNAVPCHTAATTRQPLDRNNIRVLPWCSKSSDFSPIDNLWDEVNRWLRQLPRQPHTLQEHKRDLIRV